MERVPELRVFKRPAHRAKAGLVIADRYRLEREIGAGGMATVWEATHVALNQPIALKFLEIAGPQGPALHARFLREARIAAAVRHRNVVDVSDFGKSDEGLPYMAMELLQGQTLADRLDTGEPFSVQLVVRIMARVLSGLGAAHDAGLVHRDVKPGNIFLVEDADGVYPKLLDFGISRALDRDGDIESVLDTVENTIVGTPEYMSPEQARSLPSIDHRSDLWSTGVILFELFTGELPFDGDAVGEILMRIAVEDPPDFATIRPDLAGPVEAVIMRALSKKPADRFADAREMRTSLLSAMARTAADLHAVGGHDHAAPDTFDALVILEAVEDLREPGDSGMVDFREHIELLESMRPPPPAGLAPPAPPKFEDDPFAPAEAAPADAAPAVAEAPTASHRSIFLAGAVGALSATAIGIVVFALIWPEPPAPVVAPDHPSVPAESPIEQTLPEPDALPVTVTLDAVPEGAEISIDGAVWTGGNQVELPRDRSSHTIEVRDSDGRSWTQDHTADQDGAYTVILPRR